MQTKLQELTEKIYQEGVNKAQEEAEKVISAAKKEAEDLLARAHKEAGEIIKEAQRQSDETTRNALNELQLSARQAISDIQQKVVSLIEEKAIRPEAKAAFRDSDFTRKVILEMVKNWDPSKSETVDLTVVLAADKQQEVEAFFKDKAKDLLDKGLELSFSNKLKGGFKIGPKAGGYLISFSDEDFDNFFRAYLRPKLIEMLYQQK